MPVTGCVTSKFPNFSSRADVFSNHSILFLQNVRNGCAGIVHHIASLVDCEFRGEDLREAIVGVEDSLSVILQEC